MCYRMLLSHNHKLGKAQGMRLAGLVLLTRACRMHNGTILGDIVDVRPNRHMLSANAGVLRRMAVTRSQA